MHPAKMTFQALRIAVNREYEELRLGLEASLNLLADYGKVYHSHTFTDVSRSKFLFFFSRLLMSCFLFCCCIDCHINMEAYGVWHCG
jgi:hypothetical protein